MVEQKLIRRELETSRFPVPSAAEVEPILEKFKKEHYPNPAITPALSPNTESPSRT